MSLSRMALALAILTAGLSIALKRVGEACGIEFPEVTHFAIYAPAIALGTVSWLLRPNLVSHWSIILVSAVPVVGVFYSESPSLFSNAVIVFYILSGPAIGALIDESRSWSWAGRCLVFVNAFLVFLVFALNYLCYQGSIHHAVIKFGYIPLEDGSFGANPNQMGGQLAFATVLGLILFFRSGHRASPDDRSVSNNTDFDRYPVADRADGNLVNHGRPLIFRQRDLHFPARTKDGFCFRKADWPILFASLVTTVGCLATGSRGGALSLLIGGVAAVMGSAKLQPLHRLRDTGAIVIFALLTGILVTTVAGINPILRLIDRFSQADITNITTAGSRLSIWENIFRAWTRDPGRLLMGAGTGGADAALGELDPEATLDDSGMFRRNCHNAFLEWLLSYGIVGTIPGALFALFLWLRAWHLDHMEGMTIRTSLLATLFTFAMTAVVYRHLCWPLESALVLASLCHYGACHKSYSAHGSEETRRMDGRHPSFAYPAAKTFPVGYQLSARWPIYH